MNVNNSTFLIAPNQLDIALVDRRAAAYCGGRYGAGWAFEGVSPEPSLPLSALAEDIQSRQSASVRLSKTRDSRSSPRWLNVPLFVAYRALEPCVRFLSRLIAGERTALIRRD